MDEVIEKRKKEIGQVLKVEEKRQIIRGIEKEMAKPDFWLDSQKAANEARKLSDYQNLINRFENANTEQEIMALEDLALYSGEHDENNAILSLSAGAGGTEAQDWTEILQRMFVRYGEKLGYIVEIVSQSAGEEVGIKSATLEIKGINAYGNFKSEAGVHRLVRISPFDSDKARHTSFALVEVIPEIAKVGDIEIPEKDIRIDVYRSSGPGGQGVNTTDSAVRITHLPTGIVVTCQKERSQLKNREIALKILSSKLFQLELQKAEEEKNKLKGGHVSAEWGNQIRSYVLHPYQLVKDHRTGEETADTQSVLSGSLERFNKAYLKMINK